VASSNAANANLEDYNPFDPKQAQTKAGGNNEAPAVMKPTQDAPPPYTASGQQQISTADFQVNSISNLKFIKGEGNLVTSLESMKG
jgi:hypothetical protein